MSLQSYLSDLESRLSDLVAAIGADIKLLSNQAGTDIPPGTVSWFAGPVAPTGYLKCNGAAVSRTSYSDLFSAIGTTFGGGNGSTTFNLPDLRGEFVRGWDDGRGVDSGRVLGSAQAGQNASHTHSGTTSSDGSHTHTVGCRSMPIPSGGGTYSVGGSIEQTTSSSGSHTHSFMTGSSGGTEARPRNVALLPVIKY